MIYLFFGNDTKLKRKTYLDFMKSIPERANVFDIHKNNFDLMQFESLYSSNSLFFAKSVVVLNNIFENEEIKEIVLANLANLEKSINDFIVLEGDLKKAELDAFKKVRAEINLFEKKEIKKQTFNTFILANNLGDRDKLNIWINLQMAYKENVAVDAIVGVLFWKVKDMIIKKDFKKFSLEELQKIARELPFLLSNSRLSSKDDQVSLEQFLIKIL